MKVYVFGNEDLALDSAAINVSKKLKGKIKNVEFVMVDVNQDLPFKDNENVVIMDTVLGLEKVSLILDNELDHLVSNSSLTAHDYDLAFQLKYLKKLGKLGKVTIIGLPPTGKINYSLIHSNLRKLVAQDMQGS